MDRNTAADYICTSPSGDAQYVPDPYDGEDNRHGGSVSICVVLGERISLIQFTAWGREATRRRL